MSTPHAESSFQTVLAGAIAGFVATIPMSVCMLAGWRLLPTREKYHLPPRLITEEIARRAGIEDHLSERELVGLTISSHFGYGALFGGVYAAVESRMALPARLKGSLYGILIWIASYLGWIPAMDILPPATRHPWRRNLMMIVAHIIWGVTLGEVTRKLRAMEPTKRK